MLQGKDNYALQKKKLNLFWGGEVDFKIDEFHCTCQ